MTRRTEPPSTHGTAPPSTRRAFLKALSVTTLSAAAAAVGAGQAALGCRSPQGAARRYRGLTAGSYLGGLQTETVVEGDEVFLEGPAVDRDGVVFFTNIPASHILRWDPRALELTTYRENSRKSNGLLFDRLGRLIACEGGAGRVTRTDMASGALEVLADGFEGHPLEAPNDLAVDRDGRIYFSSRPSSDVPARGYVKAVYRIDPDRSVHQVLAEPHVDMPNGLVLSPDERTLYLIEAHAEAGRARHVKAFDLGPDGSTSNPRILIDFYPGRSGDGMCIDAEGNLYVAAGLHARRGTSETLDTRPGIHVISPRGELLDYLRTPEDTLTNCTFGGVDLQTLYITAGSRLLSARASVPGHPRYRPSR